jgi:hypothetical protein
MLDMKQKNFFMYNQRCIPTCQEIAQWDRNESYEVVKIALERRGHIGKSSAIG